MATVQIKSADTDNQALVDSTGHLYVTSGGASGLVDVNLTKVGNSNITLGAKPASQSIPVIVASDEAFQTSQYTVGASAVQLTSTPLSNRNGISIKVRTTSSADAIYIGNSNAVTSSTGYPLFDGDVIDLDITTNQAIWAIGTSAGQLIYVLEIGT